MTELPSDAVGLKIEKSEIDGARVLKLTGFLDLSTVPIFDSAIEDIADNPPKVLVVDLVDVDFLGSVGLSVLARVHAELEPAGRLVVIANEVTARPLRLTGLDREFEVRDTVDRGSQ